MTAMGLYTGRGSAARQPVALPWIDLEKSVDPARYLPDPGLVDAVNVALMLRQPLLVTGEPGTGKTQLGFSVAWELDLGLPLVFETKSTSIARDLFYTFDNIQRFQASHVQGADIDPRGFVHFNALGIAIMQTLDDPPLRALVLIDEIDKAPRDFSNDMLSEIENLYFRIPEAGNDEIRANPDYRPIVIITSNSEKSLPDAFLRRCIFYHIPFPDEARLEEIVLSRVPSITPDATSLLAEVLEFFGVLRSEHTGLRKRPGTAELIGWTTALVASGANPGASLRSQAEIGARTLSVIAKHPEDQERTSTAFRAWVHDNV